MLIGRERSDVAMLISGFRALAAGGLIGGAALLGSFSAQAQNADILARLAAAEAQVGQLGDALGAPIQLAQAVPEGYAAQVELRLGQLEQSLRQLVGQVEQLQFEQRSLSDRLQRALNDIEFRLSELDGGSSSGGLSSPPPTPPSTATPANPPVVSGNAPSGAGISVQPGAGGSLGSLSAAPGTDGAAPGSGAAAQSYNAAYRLLEAGDIAGAQRGFASFVTQFPSDQLASNAHYWLGETYFAQGQFEAAANVFAQGYQRFPTGSKAVDSLFKLGLSLVAINRNRDACNAFSQLVISFPSAPQQMIDRARSELSRLQCG